MRSFPASTEFPDFHLVIVDVLNQADEIGALEFVSGIIQLEGYSIELPKVISTLTVLEDHVTAGIFRVLCRMIGRPVVNGIGAGVGGNSSTLPCNTENRLTLLLASFSNTTKRGKSHKIV